MACQHDNAAYSHEQACCRSRLRLRQQPRTCTWLHIVTQRPHLMHLQASQKVVAWSLEPPAAPAASHGRAARRGILLCTLSTSSEAHSAQRTAEAQSPASSCDPLFQVQGERLGGAVVVAVKVRLETKIGVRVQEERVISCRRGRQSPPGSQA